MVARMLTAYCITWTRIDRADDGFSLHAYLKDAENYVESGRYVGGDWGSSVPGSPYAILVDKDFMDALVNYHTVGIHFCGPAPKPNQYYQVFIY